MPDFFGVLVNRCLFSVGLLAVWACSCVVLIVSLIAQFFQSLLTSFTFNLAIESCISPYWRVNVRQHISEADFWKLQSKRH